MTQAGRKKANKAVTLRALALTLFLMPFSIVWQLAAEAAMVGMRQIIFSLLSLFFNCLFILLVLTVVNSLAKRQWPRIALAPGELLTIYILLTGVTAICGGSIISQIVPFIAYPGHYARLGLPREAQNVGLLPSWLIITDPRAAAGFWQGEAGFFSDGYWRGWLGPIAWWTLLLGIILFGLLCLSVLVRKPWGDQERLTFPIIQLPVELVSAPAVFRGRLFWAGVGFACTIAFWNGLQTIFPAMSELPTRNGNIRFPTPPWNAIGELHLYFYPFALGLAFLAPVKLSFATWFFVLFQQGELVLTRHLGWEVTPRMPFLAEQSTGALFGLIVFRLVMQRRHLLGVMRRALGLSSPLSDEDEPISYRLAGLGLLGALIAFTCLLLAMNIPLWAAGLFVVLYFIQSLGVARLRAELGPPAHDIWGADITMLMVNSLGSSAFPARGLVGLHLLRGFSQSTGDHPMPNQLEGLQMSKRLGFSDAGIFWGMLGFMVLATVEGMTILAALEHRLGAATAEGGVWLLGEPGARWWSRVAFWNPMQNHLDVGQMPVNAVTGALLGGAGFAVLLSILVIRYPYWPLHPVAFVVAQSWYVLVFVWFSIFLAWLIKLPILHYGGRSGYERALPFFYGLIVGDCLAGVIWSAVAYFLHAPLYSVWM